ncbi:MAG: recombination protein RecR [Spartobacteria bacterium]|nr:recombination protein RecR [Spartobacteria bacterium]
MIPQFDQLVRVLARLPGVGRRSAERMALRLIQDKDRLLTELQQTLAMAQENICCCRLCGGITSTERNPCSLCKDPTREPVLCVVESASDIQLLEESGGYRGYYHALSSKLSPINGQGTKALRIEILLERLRENDFKEVILAMDTDVESDATAALLVEKLRDTDVAVTRIAQGIPVGSAVGYVDGLTLSRAMRARYECGT